MISNQILQNTIYGLKSITKCDLSILDREGKVVVSTEVELPGKIVEGIKNFMLSPAEGMSLKGYNYFKVFDNSVAEYVVMAKGEDGESFRTGQLAAFQVQSLLVAYKERYDKDNFIKNLLLDNLLLIDIYSRAKKMNIESNVPRLVYIIGIDTGFEKEINILEQVKRIFPTKARDFTTAVDEKSIIIVKEVGKVEIKEDIEKAAKKIVKLLKEELGIKCRIAIGTKITDLKNVSLSYKEAKMALEVGKIFYPEKSIINYEELGIGRLIYQLPTTLCKIFIDEILNGVKLDQFEDEILATVSKFFENNLNVSETSRQLYIHRNTLVYRLDKLQKLTGLDLRSFDDAIIFKITLMVSKYMSHKEIHMF